MCKRWERVELYPTYILSLCLPKLKYSKAHVEKKLATGFVNPIATKTKSAIVNWNSQLTSHDSTVLHKYACGHTRRSRGPQGPGPLTSRFGGTTGHFRGLSVQFKSKIMNFRALIFIFSKNFEPLFAWHEYYVSFTFFLSHSAHYFILCAYFCIILTQAITFLVCKNWSKVFLHTLLDKNVIKINKYFM